MLENFFLSALQYRRERFGFTSFVLCGFPQTVEQLRFFESQVAFDDSRTVLHFLMWVGARC